LMANKVSGDPGEITRGDFTRAYEKPQVAKSAT
jgi:hypothetical protein